MIHEDDLYECPECGSESIEILRWTDDMALREYAKAVCDCGFSDEESYMFEDVEEMKQQRCPRCSELLQHEGGEEFCIGFGCDYYRNLYNIHESTTENDTSTDDIERIDGVQYATEFGSKLRVVFDHNASTNAIRKTEDITGCSGKIGAIQEHLVSVDYPKDHLQTDTRQTGRVECPRCGSEVPEGDLQEYDPNEPVCSNCREELGRMDYYSSRTG